MANKKNNFQNSQINNNVDSKKIQPVDKNNEVDFSLISNSTKSRVSENNNGVSTKMPTFSDGVHKQIEINVENNLAENSVAKINKNKPSANNKNKTLASNCKDKSSVGKFILDSAKANANNTNGSNAINEEESFSANSNLTNSEKITKVFKTSVDNGSVNSQSSLEMPSATKNNMKSKKNQSKSNLQNSGSSLEESFGTASNIEKENIEIASDLHDHSVTKIAKNKKNKKTNCTVVEEDSATQNMLVKQEIEEVKSPNVQEVQLVASTTEIVEEDKKSKVKKLKKAKVKKQKTKFKGNKKVKFTTPFESFCPDPNVGLTAEQVQERADRGLINIQSDVVTKSYFKIFRTNVFTLFNMLNFFLGTLVLIFGNVKNALFLGLITVNIIIGVIQEVRSKKTLEKMSLLSTPHVDIMRDGELKKMAIDEIVIDDIIMLKQGSQVSADSVVVYGECEANESLLTGEQDDVHKSYGDNLLSGSFIQAGSCKARVIAVGEDNFASKIMSEAKKFKKPKSELMKSINWIIRLVTIAIFPLGILMFLTNYKVSPDMNMAITSTVASIIGMIPEGLVMLTSLALAVGIIKLSKKRTLVQELYCIETLARVDCLCLDKTGTITEGTMQVEQTHIYSTKFGFVDDIMANMVVALGNDGSTFTAINEYFRSSEKYEVFHTIPFSSSRKWSGADFGENGRFIVGAPEFVLKSNYNLVENDVKEYSMQGFRVLVLVKTSQELKETMDESKMKPIALIILSDKIRENAKETFEYFARQGVTLKVISGDNPLTVSKVAERAGLSGADKFIDASQDLDTDEKIFDACDQYTIFGRVNPKQKKMLVNALKKKGYTVGMTGDGVNDVMALKEADCSIAMAAGSDASRNVSQLVLLDSDFSALPSVVAEGRRVINNIERASSLFLVKTTFSIILTLLLIIFQMKYPFQPIQMTLISCFFVGIPSFFLAIEPNDRKVEGNFLSKVFRKALPAGLTVAIMVCITSYYYKDIGIDVSAQISTMSFYITAVVSFTVLLQVCMPYTKERLFLVALCAVVFISVATSTYLAELFAIVPLTTNMALRLIIMLVCVVPCMAVMRAEVGAIKALYEESSTFIKKAKKKVDKFFGKRKNNK